MAGERYDSDKASVLPQHAVKFISAQRRKHRYYRIRHSVSERERIYACHGKLKSRTALLTDYQRVA